MRDLVFKDSRVLDDYESHKTLTFQYYGSGMSIRSKQDEVVKTNGETKNYSSLVVTGLKNSQAIELRDYLLSCYPIECDKPTGCKHPPKPPHNPHK